MRAQLPAEVNGVMCGHAHFCHTPSTMVLRYNHLKLVDIHLSLSPQGEQLAGERGGGKGVEESSGHNKGLPRRELSPST